MSGFAALSALTTAERSVVSAGVLIVVHDFHAVRRRVVGGTLPDLLRERIVGRRNADRRRFRLLRQRHLQDPFEIPARRREHGERVLEALTEDFLSRTVAFDHRDFQTLDDGGGGRGVCRTVGPEDEVHFVLRYEFLDQARRGLRIRFVILISDVDLVRLARDFDAAVRIDVVFPELVAFFRQLAFASGRSRCGERSAENDRAVVGNGRRGDGGRERQRACNCERR